MKTNKSENSMKRSNWLFVEQSNAHIKEFTDDKKTVVKNIYRERLEACGKNAW